MKLLRAFLILLPLIGGHALAHDVAKGDIVIDHPIMHPPLGRPDMTVGYMRLINKGAPDRLLSVSSDIAEKIEIHTHIMDGDVMRMRKLDDLSMPAKSAIDFTPGSYHLMIFGLKEKLVTGDEIPVTLTFKNAGEIVAPFWVEPRQAPKAKSEDPESHDHSGHH